MKPVVIESFTLDHTKVKAPYVRLIAEETGPRGDVVSNYDLRLTQPNVQAIPTGGMHTLEHLLALYMRPQIKGIWTVPPLAAAPGFISCAGGITPQKK